MNKPANKRMNVMNEQTNKRTNTQARSNMTHNFFKVGGIKIPKHYFAIELAQVKQRGNVNKACILTQTNILFKPPK